MNPDLPDGPPASEQDRRAAFRNHLYHQVTWADLDPVANDELIVRAIREDLEGFGFAKISHPSGDPTSELFLPSTQEATAHIVARENLVVAGLPLVPSILERIDPQLRYITEKEDGASVSAGDSLANISGPARSLFTAERILLNFVQMLSGIATATQLYARLLQDYSTRLLDTRKTHPGYRALTKYAVSSGGGWNHRLGLYDRIMIKDNHLAATSLENAFREAVAKARSLRPDLPIEIEIDSLDQLSLVLPTEPDVILLDNFTAEEISRAVEKINGKALTEASGNVTLETLPSLSGLGLDFISTGATVHRSRWVDLGLDIA